MKKIFAIAAVVAAVGGTALHFLYDVLPTPLTAVFAPINESPWEHLKLLFWPTVIAACAIAHLHADAEQIWSAFFVPILLMPVFLMAVYCLLVVLGLDSVPADIALYYVTMFGGFVLACELSKCRKIVPYGGFLLMLVMLYGAALVLFSFAAPDLPVFRAPST